MSVLSSQHRRAQRACAARTTLVRWEGSGTAGLPGARWPHAWFSVGDGARYGPRPLPVPCGLRHPPHQECARAAQCYRCVTLFFCNNFVILLLLCLQSSQILIFYNTVKRVIMINSILARAFLKVSKTDFTVQWYSCKKHKKKIVKQRFALFNKIFVYFCICLPVCLSIYLSMCLSACLSSCLYIYLSIYLPIHPPCTMFISIHLLSINQSINQSISQLIKQLTNQSVNKSVHKCVYLSIVLSIYLSVWMPFYLPIYLSINQALDLSIYLFICLAIYLLNEMFRWKS